MNGARFFAVNHRQTCQRASGADPMRPRLISRVSMAIAFVRTAATASETSSSFDPK